MPGSKRCGAPILVLRERRTQPGKFQYVEADMAVDHVDQPARVEHDVVALRRRAAAGRLRNEIADLARRHRIGDVDDA